MENMDKKDFPKVDPNGLCPNYIKGDHTLPEEMDTCDRCRYFIDDSDRCSNPFKG